jgi:DNA-binding transcriptional ArsR family regulator
MAAMSRPLPHPSADDITVEGILHALSDPVRADLFARIAAAQCALTCTSVVEASAHQVPKSTLSQHFKALRDAGLIRSERKGVEMHNTSRCEEVNRRFPGLLPAIMEARKSQLRRKARAKPSSARPSRSSPIPSS